MKRGSSGAAVPGALSLRTRLILIFAALSLGATTLFGWLAYSASRESLRGLAQSSTQIAAQERTDALRRKLESRVERAGGFQDAYQEVCGPGGRSAEATGACLDALTKYREIEGFSAAALTREGSPPVLLGPGASTLVDAPPFAPGQIARFGRDASGRPHYVVHARSRDGRTLLALRFENLQPILAIFEDSRGLGGSGETFLAGEHGYFITPPRHSGPAGTSHPIVAEPMRRCLSGHDGVMLAPDYRGGDVIHAFKRVDFIGGGCVMAHIGQAEAFAPARALGGTILGLGFGVVLVFVLASVVLARSVSRPILRLSGAARALERGDLAHPIPAEGPAEVRTLAGALSSMARAIRERTEALEEANQSKTDFLAAMSHELRTPLNAIAGYVDLLELGVYGPTSPEQLNALDRVRRSQRSLLALINDILQYAKMDAGKLEFAIKDVPVSVLLADLDALAEPQVRTAGLSYSVDPCDADLAVRADPERAQQILLNLLTNAVKFTPAGGRIRVSCEARDRRVDFRVHDTGRGIPAEMVERIFDPFVQVRNTSDRDASREGVGLGLAISRDLARGMGGDLTVESVPGHGSTFTLTLPAQSGMEKREEHPSGEGRGIETAARGLR